MAQNDTDQQIRSRINAFLSEISALMKRAALESVHEALGEGSAPRRRGPGRPRGSGRRGRGRPRKVRAGRRVRRSLADLDKIAARVLAQVKSKAGQRLEEIAKALRTDTSVLKRPVSMLLAAKKLKTKGRKRGTMYFAGGGRGGAGKRRRKAKAQRRRRARGNRKTRVKRGGSRKKAARRAAARTLRPAQARRAKTRRRPSRATPALKARAVVNALAPQAAIPTTPL